MTGLLNKTTKEGSIYYEIPIVKCNPEWFKDTPINSNFASVPLNYFFCPDVNKFPKDLMKL